MTGSTWFSHGEELHAIHTLTAEVDCRQLLTCVRRELEFSAVAASFHPAHFADGQMGFEVFVLGLRRVNNALLG